jgi:hypothetical protein
MVANGPLKQGYTPRWGRKKKNYTEFARESGSLSRKFLLRIVHDRFGRSSDNYLNGHLHYPNDIDNSLNESATDKIRKNRPDYNNNPPNSISFIPGVVNTSGGLHSEFVSLLFLHAQEADHSFAASGVQFAQSNRDQFNYRHGVLLSP